jgi:hypothetical protein
LDVLGALEELTDILPTAEEGFEAGIELWKSKRKK